MIFRLSTRTAAAHTGQQQWPKVPEADSSDFAVVKTGNTTLAVFPILSAVIKKIFFYFSSINSTKEGVIGE